MESYFVTLEMTFRVFHEVKYLILYSIEAKTEHTLRTRLSQRHHHYSSVHSCWSISLIQQWQCTAFKVSINKNLSLLLQESGLIFFFLQVPLSAADKQRPSLCKQGTLFPDFAVTLYSLVKEPDPQPLFCSQLLVLLVYILRQCTFQSLYKQELIASSSVVFQGHLFSPTSSFIGRR